MSSGCSSESTTVAVSQRTLSAYLDEIAQPTATPGGGSVAATTAAMAAALLSMVAGITRNKTIDPATGEYFKQTLGELELLRSTLLRLAADDESAFGRYIEAVRLPRSTDEEMRARNSAMQLALKHATEVPLQIARACQAILVAASPLVEVVTVNAISDAIAAALLAEAAGLSAIQNVAENAAAMTDETQRVSFRKETVTLQRSLSGTKDEVLRKAQERQAASH